MAITGTRFPLIFLFLTEGLKVPGMRGWSLLAESPVIVGQEMWFYYGGFPLNHNAENNITGIGLATTDCDRLVGVRPVSDDPGFLLTRPFPAA